MYEQVVKCQKCQSERSPDLKIPCRTCGARSTVFGYLYEHEVKTFTWASAAVSVFVLLACISTIIFLVIQYLIVSR